MVLKQFEGFGLPLLEAIASGASCLTSECPSLNEAGGDIAEYCNHEPIEVMAIEMKNLIENLTKLSDLRIHGRKYFKQFPWERTAKETIRIYEDILGTLLT